MQLKANPGQMAPALDFPKGMVKSSGNSSSQLTTKAVKWVDDPNSVGMESSAEQIVQTLSLEVGNVGGGEIPIHDLETPIEFLMPLHMGTNPMQASCSL